jgi:bifunctional non-homologous end joining protein LigD
METFKFKSSSSNAEYVVRRNGDKVWCDCPGWKFAKSTPKECKHTRQVASGSVKGEIVERKEPSAFMKVKTKEFGFIKPMLAEKLPAGFFLRDGEWAVEEKYDGHRLIVSVHGGAVTAWARSGKERVLPDHIVTALEQFPSGTYDGELTAGEGGRSYNVTEKSKVHLRRFVVFDILRLLNQSLVASSYDQRRRYMREIFKTLKFEAVQMAKRWDVDTIEEAMGIYKEIRKRDGEGIILKRRLARYTIGKRTEDFLKVKALKHAVLTVTGFKPSKGKKIDRGPFAVALLEDSKGNKTKVKVLDDDTLADLMRAWNVHIRKPAFSKAARAKQEQHPYVGRKLCIDYQERTPDGSYRHPRWDRWEDE